MKQTRSPKVQNRKKVASPSNKRVQKWTLMSLHRSYSMDWTPNLGVRHLHHRILISILNANALYILVSDRLLSTLCFYAYSGMTQIADTIVSAQIQQQLLVSVCPSVLVHEAEPVDLKSNQWRRFVNSFRGIRLYRGNSSDRYSPDSTRERCLICCSGLRNY